MKLFKQIVIVSAQVECPYCGKPNQLDPAFECCGEVHAELLFSDSNGNRYAKYELDQMRADPVSFEVIREDLGESENTVSDKELCRRDYGMGEV